MWTSGTPQAKRAGSVPEVRRARAHFIECPAVIEWRLGEKLSGESVGALDPARQVSGLICKEQP
jgi:hypothetical protein